MYGYIKGTHPSITTLSGLNGKQTDTGGEHHAVNNIDTAQLRCGETGGIEGSGEFRTDVEMNYLKTLFHKRPEKVEKALNTWGRGFRESSVFPIAGIHVSRGERLTVQKSGFSQGNRERNHLNLKPGTQFRGKIAGAVCRDNDRLVHVMMSPLGSRCYRHRDKLFNSVF